MTHSHSSVNNTPLEPLACHFIDGAPVEDSAGRPLDCVNPADGTVITQFHAATDAVIDQAIASSQRAQHAWAQATPAARGRVLRRAADILRERNRAFSALESLDTGKPIQETLVSDASTGADALEYFGGMAATLTGEHIPLGDDFVYTRREPLGVCLGIGAWNYPTQIACWKAAPALACGNSTLFKPAELTPLCAVRLAEVFIEAGAPPGLFNVVQGDGATGAQLVSDPRIAKVSLTGSVDTGRRVYAAAGAGIKHVTMELGGKSALIIFDDADLDDAVGGALLGNFYASGQVCSNGTRVFVHRRIQDAFIERCVQRTQAMRIGDPQDEATQLGPLVSQTQLDTVMGYIALGQQEGAELLTGGQRLSQYSGFYVEPTIFSNVRDDMRIAREEIFGPVMSILPFDTEAEVIERANSLEFGLSAGVFTRDVTRAHRVTAQLQAGSCWINTYNLSPVEAPFGGVKQSGVGRENSAAAIAHYSQLKSVYVAMGPVSSSY